MASKSVKKDTAYFRFLCDKSFFHFVKIVGSVVGQGGDISLDIHKPLCDFWQLHPSKRKAIFMPRGWGKSTVFTEWGSVWLYLQDSNVRTLIVSQNEDIASRFLFFIQKQFLTNERLRTLYPELEQINQSWTRAHRWSGTYCDLPRGIDYKEPSITSIGVGGAAQSGHYPFIHIDDPVGQKHIDSPIEMEKIFRYHDNIKELLVNPNYLTKEGSTISIQCTFWGSGDYGTYVMDNYPEFHWRVVPALKDIELGDEENFKWIQHPNIEHFECNWPNAPKELGYSTEYYHEMMANPEQDLIFWSQQMNNPKRASGLNKFMPEWFRWYKFIETEEGLAVQCEEDKEIILISDMRLFGMIDPGGFAETKLMKKGSRNAIVIGGQSRDSIKKFVLHAWCGRLKKPSDFLKQVFGAHKKWHPRMWQIDSIGAQEYIKKDIMEECGRQKMRLPLSSIPKTSRKDEKDDDIQGLMPPMENGEIYFHRNMNDLKVEIKNYPHGLTVDLIDMLGKLNRLHWSRKRIGHLDTDYESSYRTSLQTRNGITGY